MSHERKQCSKTQGIERNQLFVRTRHQYSAGRKSLCPCADTVIIDLEDAVSDSVKWSRRYNVNYLSGADAQPVWCVSMPASSNHQAGDIHLLKSLPALRNQQRDWGSATQSRARHRDSTASSRSPNPWSPRLIWDAQRHCRYPTSPLRQAWLRLVWLFGDPRKIGRAAQTAWRSRWLRTKSVIS